MIKAKYTVVLKTLLDDPTYRPLIDKALSSYPLYEKKSPEVYIPSYVPTREELNKKLLDHYKYREIGFETPARFVDELEIALNEIMPKYNLLYHSADQDFKIIWNVDYMRDTERTQSTELTGSSTSGSETTANDSSSTSSDVESHNKHVKTNTPQSQINTPAHSIDSISYADNVEWGKDNSSSSGSSQGNSSSQTDSSSSTSSEGSQEERIQERIQGNYGQVSAQSLVKTYRETIYNIDKMLIEDKRIKELFMLIY